MNDYIEKLLEYAKNCKIGYELLYLSPITPSASNAKTRMIAINMNWHRKKELPFQIAHEIAHVLNRDDASILYFSTDVSHSKIEHAANSKAVDILMPMYFSECALEYANSEKFMSDFLIPGRMQIEVFCMVKKFLENK
ncbi:ImmA/IrrE family metallo-endopeptidase [Liquorilactobacillus nagelii]|uniref:ImmA/IrrE family metallo-endopeptidase n=1 Tax=Liquorilactobacillus nagelii TaxID=82688 RepID=UPI0039E90C66